MVASDIVNILCYSEQWPFEEKLSGDCKHVIEHVFDDLSKLTTAPSVGFHFNLAGFLVKSMNRDDLTLFYENCSRDRKLQTFRSKAIFCFSLFITGSPAWSKAVEEVVEFLSDEQKSAEEVQQMAQLMGHLMQPHHPNESNLSSYHPRRLISLKVPPLRKQALFARLCPPLVENVSVKKVNVVANLTLITDLTQMFHQNASQYFDKMWPSVVDQLDALPKERLHHILNLLRLNLDSILNHNEAYRLTEVLLKCCLSHLVNSPLELRLASAQLLLNLADKVQDHSTLLQPVQKRIVKSLRQCLSDHKRIVRQTASNAINKWSCSV